MNWLTNAYNAGPFPLPIWAQWACLAFGLYLAVLLMSSLVTFLGCASDYVELERLRLQQLKEPTVKEPDVNKGNTGPH
jgi:hypothetical protein